MFIFAKCVLAEMYQQPSKEALLQEWGPDSFPRELNEVYVTWYPEENVGCSVD